MLDLIKVDLKRILKDKLFFITLILGGVFAVVTPILNKVLGSMLNMEETMGMVLDAKTMFFDAFKPANNFGLLLPVFMAVILCKDFSYGTIRNKILAGKSRLEIFLASFVATAIVTCLTMLLHALLSLVVSLLFFEYQATAFTASDFGYLLLSVFFEMLLYLSISAMLACICVAFKNMGLSIVSYIALNFLLSIVGSITMTVNMMAAEGAKNAFVNFLDKANLFTSSVIGGGVTYTFADTMYVLIPTLLGTAAFLLLGYLAFRKKDLK